MLIYQIMEWFGENSLIALYILYYFEVKLKPMFNSNG